MKEKTYSYDDVEAAMCIWEWLLDKDERVKGSSPKANETINGLFETYGAGGMRSAAIQLAESVEAAWRISQERDLPDDIGEDSFDWEFVPAVCRLIDWPKLLENNQYGDGLYQMSGEEIIAGLIAMKALAA